jgi:glutamate formiminotransferase
LIPAEALFETADYYLQLETFQLSQVLENKLLEDNK